MGENETARTLVLLGAGASADAGLPVTSALASAVIEKANLPGRRDRAGRATDWVRALNAVYGGMVGYQGTRGANPLSAVNIETLISAVRLLRARDSHEVAPFVAAWSPMLSDFGSSDIPDSAGRQIADVIGGALGRGFASSGSEITRAVTEIARAAIRPDLERPFADAETFILRSLVDLLGNLGDVSYLYPLMDLAHSQPGGLDIVTLNYDLTIETAAAQRSTHVNRGIEEWRPGEPVDFEMCDGVLNLLKLHGSLDWRLAQSDRDLARSLTAPRIAMVDPAVLQQGDERDELPWIVVGDREKLATDGPTLALNAAARQVFRRASHLAVVGYSFGDVHVNAMIRDWLAMDPRRTMSVLDLSWPREQHHGKEPNFRDALVQTFAVDRDSQNDPVLPRVVLLEGSASDEIEATLLARPAMPTDSLATVEAACVSGAIRLTLTWHGQDLNDVNILGRVWSPPRGRQTLSQSIELYEEPPVESAQNPNPASWSRAIQIATWRSSTEVVLYVRTLEVSPIEISIEGGSITGRRYVTCVVELPRKPPGEDRETS